MESLPISRVLSWATIHLGRPLLTGSSSLPGGSASRINTPLFGLAPNGVCRAVHIAVSAVGSYPTVSPLPDLTRSHRRSVLCCTVRRLGAHRNAPCCARLLAGILLYGARTFLHTHACSGCLADFPRRIIPFLKLPCLGNLYSPRRFQSSSLAHPHCRKPPTSKTASA